MSYLEQQKKTQAEEIEKEDLKMQADIPHSHESTERQSRSQSSIAVIHDRCEQKSLHHNQHDDRVRHILE